MHRHDFDWTFARTPLLRRVRYIDGGLAPRFAWAMRRCVEGRVEYRRPSSAELIEQARDEAW